MLFDQKILLFLFYFRTVSNISFTFMNKNESVNTRNSRPTYSLTEYHQNIDLTWLDSSHVHVNVLGHTLTPFLSVESCHLRLFHNIKLVK